jgi:hypothetical protein
MEFNEGNEAILLGILCVLGGLLSSFALLLIHSPAHKLHDFQAIPILQVSLRPHLAAHDLAVQLHRNPIWLHAQLFQQGSQGKAARQLALLAINLQLHSPNL